MGKFLVDFVGRNFSGDTHVNFLYQTKNIYFMDNHRLALWCMYQKLQKNEKYNLLHIDAHYDTSLGVTEHLSTIDLFDCDLKTYLSLKDQNINDCLIRFDNYLPVLWLKKDFLFQKKIAVTHQVGAMNGIDLEVSDYHLLPFLNSFSITQHKWIVNLDFDFFYSRQVKGAPMYSDFYIDQVFQKIKDAYDDDQIAIITVALSPECCGGWPEAESILERFNKIFKINSFLT